MADKPKINTGVLYGIVADTMPMEGRDYTIDAATGEDGKPRLTIKALTDIGRAFVPVLITRLTRPMGDNGVAVAGDGPVAQEVMTIRSVRAKVEAEAAAARQAKLKEADDDKQKKLAALAEIRKARFAGPGEKAPPTSEEEQAARDANRAATLAWRLHAIDERIPKMRAEIDAAAKAAAEDDEHNGKSWAVDMDAPLTSLFDRQDVTDKFRLREGLAGKMAENAFEADELRNRAVAVAKQYILHKK